MNRQSEGKSSGIPHLAKNERDMGHPSFVREREVDPCGTECVREFSRRLLHPFELHPSSGNWR
jgi:hypothetical protein